MSQLLNMPLSQLFKKPTMNMRTGSKLTGKRQDTKLKIALSLDIGSCNTKMLIGRHKADTLLVEQALITRTPKNACVDGAITDIESLEPILKSLIAQDRTMTKDLIFTIESTKIIKREFIIPQIPEEDILGLVTYEMEQYLPIDISEYTIQPKIIGNVMDGGAESTKVLVSAVPKNIIQTYQKLFTAAGLRPVAMNINSNSIEKLIQFDIMHNPASEYIDKNVVFIDMGHSCFNVSVYENGKFQFSRAVEIGGQMLDTMIAELLQMDVEKAQSVKKDVFSQLSVMELNNKYGHLPSGYQPQSIYETALIELVAIINHWTKQIYNVLQYMTRSRERNIDKIYIYGGSSLINGFSGFLEKELAIKTANISSLNSCEYAPGVDARNLITTHGNALGAILRL